MARPAEARRTRGVVSVLTAVACAFALAVAPSATAGVDLRGRPGADLPRLKGSVGPGYEISIEQESVPAGRYKIVVRDRSTIHNFHFFGSGVDRKTGVAATGRTVWRVTLTQGTYIAACVPHGSMSTQLQVT